MELVPGLHWIEGQRSNIYIWEGNTNPILVDTGMPGDVQIILDTIREIGYQPADIEAIFITHADLDHAGSAAVLQKQTNATIYAGSQTAEYLQQGKSPKHMPWLVQFFLDRLFTATRQVPAEAIRVVSRWRTRSPDSGNWLVLSTPGHTLDHFAFCSSCPWYTICRRCFKYPRRSAPEHPEAHYGRSRSSRSVSHSVIATYPGGDRLRSRSADAGS